VRPTAPGAGGHSQTQEGGEPPGKANSAHEADLLERVHEQNWLSLEFYTVLNMLGTSVTSGRRIAPGLKLKPRHVNNNLYIIKEKLPVLGHKVFY